MKKSKKKKMYSVVGLVTGSKFLGIFEASSEDEAIEMALNSDAAYVSLCHQCSSQCEDGEIQTASAHEDSL